MNLMNLKGYESGVVIYTPVGAMMEGFVANWSSIDGLPRILATGLIGLGDGDDLQPGEPSQDEIDMALELAREEDDSPEIDRVWSNDSAVVFTFKGWN